MPRKNYTPEERALHLIGALAGKSLKEINAAVAHSDSVKFVPGERRKELPQSSLDMLRGKYASALTAEARQIGLRGIQEGQELWSDIWDHCVSPKTLGDL